MSKIEKINKRNPKEKPKGHSRAVKSTIIELKNSLDRFKDRRKKSVDLKTKNEND